MRLRASMLYEAVCTVASVPLIGPEHDQSDAVSDLDTPGAEEILPHPIAVWKRATE